MRIFTGQGYSIRQVEDFTGLSRVVLKMREGGGKSIILKRKMTDRKQYADGLRRGPHEGQIKWPLNCLQASAWCVMVDERINLNGVRRSTGLRQSAPFPPEPRPLSSPLGIFRIQTSGLCENLNLFATSCV
jgi:hypothetical protein